MALGTGARATGAGTHAQADNPANLVVGGLYHIESITSYAPQFKRFGFGASVVDSMTSKLAAGLSVRGLYGDNKAGENSGWEGRLGLGLPIGDMLAVGVSGRYANFTISDPHARAEQPTPEGEREDQTFKLKRFTLDTAISLRLSEGLVISALAYNLVDTDSPLAPMMVGGSLGYSLGPTLTLGGDVLVDLNRHGAFDGAKLQAGGGLEYLVQGAIPVRFGYLFDQGREQHAITGGIGYVDQRFGAIFGMRQTVSGSKETNLMLSLQYFVQ